MRRHSLDDEMNGPGKLYVKTFGCQMNVYDTEKIYAFLQDSYVPAGSAEEADLIILNTCSIREKAEQKVYSLLGRIKHLKDVNPDLLIGVGGCVAQQEGNRILKRSPMVDVVFGTHNVNDLPGLIEERVTNGKRICRVREDTGSVPASEAPRVKGSQGATSLITIMKGCDNYCAYCVVPLVRGREISRSASEILDEAAFLIEGGVREITLLGQNVNSYHDPDTGMGFVSLLEALELLDGLERVRFVTSHPKDFSTELAHAMAELKSVCEHIHLPIQAGSDRILAAMGRGYTSRQYLEKVDLLKNLIPAVEFTTDVIVGFPGEERSDFKDTLDILKTVRYQNVFSFRFSPRPGTTAALMEDPVDIKVKRPWLPELQELQNRITDEKHREMIDTQVEVLVEGVDKKKSGYLEGRTRTNYIVHFPGDPALTNQMVRVKITDAHTFHLIGKMVN